MLRSWSLERGTPEELQEEAERLNRKSIRLVSSCYLEVAREE